jgi:hypothetical protein
MKTNTEEGNTQHDFNAEASFGKVCLDSCRKLLARIENAKADIVAEFRDKLEEHQHVLELAVNEAEALAWEEGLPQLLFPTLAVEKASAVATWHNRQQSLLRRTSPMLAAA